MFYPAESTIHNMKQSFTIGLGFPKHLGVALLFTGALLSFPFVSDAKRASRNIITVSQTDGTSLRIQKHGDEYGHFITTDDGIPVIKVNGNYYYAMESESQAIIPSDIIARPAELRSTQQINFLKSINAESIKSRLSTMQTPNRTRPEGITPSGKATRGPGLSSTTFPAYGEQKGLVILVEFSDKKFSTPNPREYFTRLLNEEGFKEYGATGSARDWFVQNSNGKFTPEFDVYGPVTLPQRMKYYGGNDYYGDDKNPVQMVLDAANLLNGEIDFNEYDRDHNKQVDNVYIFYAGYGEADCDDEDTIWPHSWDISQSGNSSPLLDGCVLEHYACSSELDGTHHRPDGIGTFVHEFSHVLGLPDLYYTGTSSRNTPFTPQEYSVLDYGPYNNEGRTPPNYSAYERYALDWMSPEELSVTKNCTLVNLADSNHAFIVKTERENEYFLLENRQQVGNDTYIPGHGMIVWHIDYNKSVFDNNTVNNTKNHQYVDLVEADGTQSLNDQINDVFPGPTYVTEFHSGTNPRFTSWAGKNPAVGLYYIEETPDSKITFRAVKYGDDPTKDPDDNQGVASITENPSPYTEGNILHLNGNSDVYDPTGRLIFSNVDNVVSLPSSGLYFVISDKGSYKVMVK